LARQTLTAREAWSAVAFSLMLIAGLWIYRSERVAIQDQLDKQRPYRTLVTSLQKNREFLLNAYLAQPRLDIPPGREEPAEHDIPELVVFTDFECPGCHCNQLAIQNQVLKAFNGRLTVSVRHYPLDSACNDSVDGALHPHACGAAYAAEAARALGGEAAFWQAQEFLFRHRKNLSSERYREMASQIGLDSDRFVRAMQSDAIREIVGTDIELAERLEVTATPTMFLNGRRLNRLLRGPVFWQVVADAWSASQDEMSEFADRQAAAHDTKQVSTR
ncbi:MAG: thioredoxin domain-containing protein, partial [Planctomycetes bacterium]|nr:thioredoxin domain-containing protein [Planctomycetota bacterium]